MKGFKVFVVRKNSKRLKAKLLSGSNRLVNTEQMAHNDKKIENIETREARNDREQGNCIANKV